MNRTLNSSLSLIASLSRESQSIRQRSQNIIKSIMNCKNKELLFRLKNELSSLEQRRYEIGNIAISIRDSNYMDTLSIEFLIEISNRPLIYSNKIL